MDAFFDAPSELDISEFNRESRWNDRQNIMDIKGGGGGFLHNASIRPKADHHLTPKDRTSAQREKRQEWKISTGRIGGGQIFVFVYSHVMTSVWKEWQRH